MEFWAMSGVGQLGRIPVGTVSIGGNGQFTRLTALNELGDRPWSQSLTEDLDLGISLCLRGWRTSSTPAAYVTQQGLNDLRSLIKQRTRWYQGHMMCGRRLLELVRSRYLDNWGFFELSMYLAVPWLITLPWSLIQQYLLVQIASGHGLPNQVFASASWSGRVAYLAVWYLISFAPHLFWGMLYWRRSRTVSLARGLAMAHLMIPWSYVSYFAAWRAVGRIILGRTQWTKTRRVVEARHTA
jgi:cellulose synthase/poly-beta-1,6-N-acetylglucosamine synthase-like glycosyltransferase